MKSVLKFNFHKTKYGDELLVDVVELKDIKKYISDSRPHSLTYYDITLITKGEGFFRIEEKEYNAQAGDVIFSLPGQRRNWDTGGIINGYALIFEEEFLLTFFNDPDFLNNISYFNRFKAALNSKLPLTEDEYRQTELLINEIRNEIKEYAEKDKHILRAILYRILKYLDRIYLSNRPDCKDSELHSRHVGRFIQLVNSNFRQHHSVQYYANEICITAKHLNELVSEHTGSNVKQIIQNKLLGEAKKLLLYTNYSVEEIAANLHFEDTSYFIRSFRKHTGLTPLQFRNGRKP